MEKFLKDKVMIVDDDQTIVFPIEMSLQEKGIETISFTDGEKALEYLRQNKVSVILLDYHMEPNINGDEFIKRLREFDKETIIYLQTAYSEDLPAIDMLENYQIQGYIDKGKSDFERMQLIISALKHAQTLELVKEQEKQIDAKDYQNKFLGKFLNRLMGEFGERSFAMSGNILILEEFGEEIAPDKKELYNRSLNNIKVASSKLNEMIKSIELEEEDISIKVLENTLNKLFESVFCIRNVTLNIRNETNNDYQMFKCDAKVLIYFLVDIIENLVEKGETQINLLVEKIENAVTIKVCSNIENNELVEKIEKLAKLDNKIKVINEYGQIKIRVEL
ncbi:MAG: response regulator [Clostridia bacterium]|nr:response regulator [Clostridia bacterium]